MVCVARLYLHDQKRGSEFSDVMWGSAVIGQIGIKADVVEQNCDVAQNSRGLVEFALLLAISTSQHPGGAD